ncbi:MAG TPA: FAD-dependent oxidoreductase, partial [Anseongella sp.]|nr:FAD-dependent oxidoreductase [Anseongella sp.]
MQRDSSTESIWQPLAAPQLPDSNLEKDEHFDVAIVGGGITGLTTAVLLQRAGKKCMVLEARTLGFGTTSGTTAHLNTLIDTPYHQLEKDFGEEGARLTATATGEAISLVQGLVESCRIDCDFEYAGGYVFSEDPEESSELEKMSGAAQRAGIATSFVPGNQLPIPFHTCLEFPGQARFHPMKYLYSLADEFISQGGRISQN